MFIRHEKDKVVYYTIPSFEQTGLVKHAFSSRKGGISSGSYSSLNLGFNTKDDRENIVENYKIICKALEINPENLVLSNQIHEDGIAVVNSSDRGKGIWRDSDINGVDGLITNDKEVALVTFYADCVPLFFLDPVKKVIGLSHAGWRGTVLEIGKKTIEKMTNQFQCNPKDVLVGIGPSIGHCCFEVDENVVIEFQKNIQNIQDAITAKQNNKYHIDLWAVNKKSLMEAGVPENNITISSLCTVCNQQEFFSHRGQNGIRGTLAAVMELV